MTSTDPENCCPCDAATIATAIDALADDLGRIRETLDAILHELERQSTGMGLEPSRPRRRHAPGDETPHHFEP